MSELVPIPSPGESLHFGEVGSPLIVLLHDWYGRLPALDQVAQALARQGYRVVVPDLYDGVCTTDDDTAETLLEQLDVGFSLAIIDDAIGQARIEGSERVGTVGFSMGGWLGLLHAQGGAVDAVVAYYASLSPSDHGVIPCPVLLQLAEYDEWGEGQDPEEFVGRLKEHGTPVKTFSYVGTQHSFANPTIREKSNAQATALAFARSVSFLDQYLRE